MIYRYEEGGRKKYSDTLPSTVGTRYDVIDGSGRVVDNGVVGQLTTRQMQVKAASDAAAARNAASAQKARALERAQAEALRDRQAAAKKLEAAGTRLNAARGALFSEIQATNKRLGQQDAIQDGVSYALGAAGLAAAIFATGGTALIIGTALTVTSWVNSDVRQSNPNENTAADTAGKINDLTGIADDAAEFASTAYKGGGNFAPAARGLGIAGGLAGAGGAIYEAQTSTAGALEPRIYSTEQLRGFRDTVDLYTADKNFVGGQKNMGVDGPKLKQLATEAEAAQAAYDEAAKEFIEKEYIYLVLLRAAAATYSAPR
ncbi:MAG: hypothetical protein JNL21_35615 [Myxococcales bacterium]|nr:hypothetical protein [Myxococcales bacterium]